MGGPDGPSRCVSGHGMPRRNGATTQAPTAARYRSFSNSSNDSVVNGEAGRRGGGEAGSQVRVSVS